MLISFYVFRDNSLVYYIFVRFRCTEEGDKHLVYVTEKDSDFPSNDDPTTEITGDNNVVVFDDIKFTIKSGTEYKWRVDCVEGETSKTRRGDTWSFTMQ